jgi:uncharacterized protein
MIKRTVLPVLAGLALAIGCVKSSPPVVFHTLTPLETANTTQGKALAVEIAPVLLPDLLQRSQIVILKAPGVHRLSETHRWGNTLEKDIQRVLVDDLSALLGGGPAVPYPEGGRVKAAYRITLEVQQFDGELGGTLVFQGTWMVTRMDNDQMVLLRKSSLQEPVKGSAIEDLVAAHDRILDALSREIASGLGSLPN